MLIRPWYLRPLALPLCLNLVHMIADGVHIARMDGVTVDARRTEHNTCKVLMDHTEMNNEDRMSIMTLYLINNRLFYTTLM